MATKPNTAAAKAFGSIAFAAGKMASPALDSNMMEMISGRQVGDKRTIKEFKAWLEGWVKASLSKEC